MAGADAVLLIAECLDDCNLRQLHNQAIELGMTPLGGILRAGESAARPGCGGQCSSASTTVTCGTFHTDLDHTIRMSEDSAAGLRACVGESGIRGRADVERLEAAGVQAMLVGETFMRGGNVRCRGG